MRRLTVVLSIVAACAKAGAGASAPVSAPASAPVPAAAPGGDAQPPYWRERTSFFRSFAQPADVVMAGDSLTDDAEWREIFPALAIVNRGIDGDTTEGLLARLDDIVRLQPKAVFVMIGINDFADGRRSVAAVLQSYRAIVARLAQRGTRVYVQSTLPCNEALAAWKSCVALNPKIAQLNAALAGLQSAAVTWIDLTPALAGRGGLKREYSVDGVHLNGDGYRAWRDVIAPYMPAAAQSQAHSQAQSKTQPPGPPR